MLRSLHVKNLAVLAEAAVQFGPGFNVLTGETGAGKSIVLDSLALLAGARASAELIRTGAETLTVTGLFRPASEGWRAVLEEAGVGAEGDELVIRRQINREGRNRVFINDEPVTLRLLSDLAPPLLSIHGQREELGLVVPDLQRGWLDRQGGAKAKAILEECAERYATYQDYARRLERLTGDERTRLERLDLLRFQANEIDGAKLRAGEEQELRREREVLRHSEAIRAALGSSLSLLLDDEGSASERIARSRSQLAEIEEWEPQAKGSKEELDVVQIRLDELARNLRQRFDEVEADPNRLNALEERLGLINRLCRKYGATTEEILARREAIEEELSELEGDDALREEIEGKLAEALDRYRETALALAAKRADWAASLKRTIGRELGELALKKARFSVKLERRLRPGSALRVDGEAVEFGPSGFDQVVFEFSPNPGEDLRPLARVASGGELSRVYLALQVAARGKGEAAEATLVFDEVDAGIGGLEAAVLGRKLKGLAHGGQILVVTHLPQVASHGDHHFKVSKEVRKGRTHVSVDELDSDSRVEEVARMLAGEEITRLSRSHAEELIAGAERGVS